MNEQETDPTDQSTSPQPVTRYVNLLLYKMAKEGTSVYTVRESEPLPALQEFGNEKPTPELADIIARLRKLSGLESSSTPTEQGAIELRIAGKPFSVEVKFDDASDTKCVIRMQAG